MQPESLNYHMSSLYVGDLHCNTTEAMLFEKFSSIGPLMSIRICRDKITDRSLGYAFVNYYTHEHAENALATMNSELINGHPIRLTWSHRNSSGVGNIFIKNMDKNIDIKTMYKVFSVHGNVLSCKIITDDNGVSKGYGYVHFDTEEAAKKSIARLNGMYWNGRRVYVRPFISKNKRKKQLDKQLNCTSNGTSDNYGVSKGNGFKHFKTEEVANTSIETVNGELLESKKVYIGHFIPSKAREAQLDEAAKLFVNGNNCQ